MLDITHGCVCLIVGYGISGQATERYLVERGYSVIVYDDQVSQCKIDWEKIDVVIKSPGIKYMTCNAHFIIQEARLHNIPILSHYDVWAKFHPNAYVIAVTGSNGKSTTTTLIHHIIAESGIKCSMGGNIGIPFCAVQDADIYVFEMSSYELACSQFLNFEICCLTNIVQNHLDWHGSFENYIAAKHKALSSAKNKIILQEDAYTFNKYRNEAVVVSNTGDNNADVATYGTVITAHDDVIFDSSLTKLVGRHNCTDAAFAYAACKIIGLSDKEITNAIYTYKPLHHRMEHVRSIRHIEFIDDSKATNPGAAAFALETFYGCKIYWLVGGRSKKLPVKEVVGKYLSSVEKIYLFGESRLEFEAIFKDSGKSVVCDGMRDAINTAYNDAKHSCEKTVILLSPMCASFDEFRDFEERGNVFCRIVNNLDEA